MKYKTKPKEPEIVEVWQLTKDNWRELEAMGKNIWYSSMAAGFGRVRAIQAIGNWKTPDDILGLAVNKADTFGFVVIKYFAEFDDYIMKNTNGFSVIKSFQFTEWEKEHELIA